MAENADDTMKLMLNMEVIFVHSLWCSMMPAYWMSLQRLACMLRPQKNGASASGRAPVQI
jgi:hypothetical protein